MLHPVSRPRRTRLAIGPKMPGWGSWEWLGADLLPNLAEWYDASTFGLDGVAPADIVLMIKHPYHRFGKEEIAPETPVIFLPVDHYGSAGEIDTDAGWLRRCARIVVHCSTLRQYFAPYARVCELDHHVKFVPPEQVAPNPEGDILWVGARSNLEPLVNWVNQYPLPKPLVVLTNLEDPADAHNPATFGFRPGLDIQIEMWTPERHLAALHESSVALDIKGTDFRQQHKPPTKAVDFIAAGLPLAMNPGSSSVEYLADLGFDVPSPEDFDYWFSGEYAAETRRFGKALRELLSRDRVARRMRRIIDAVLAEQPRSNTLRHPRPMMMSQ